MSKTSAPASASVFEIDVVERSIANSIRGWKPGQPDADLWRQYGASIPNLDEHLKQVVDDFAAADQHGGSSGQVGDLIDEALRATTESNQKALVSLLGKQPGGLPISALSLLQSWMEMAVDARVLRQTLVQRVEFERLLGTIHQVRTSTSELVQAAEGRNPAAPLSAAELGQVMGGLNDESVRRRERDGEVFSILRAGRKRGREYPAFQAWDGVAGEPLKKVLTTLGAPAAVGAEAYGFFTTPNDLLIGLTPIEALHGSLTSARNISPAGKALLQRNADTRLDAVLKAAEVFAAEAAA